MKLKIASILLLVVLFMCGCNKEDPVSAEQYIADNKLTGYEKTKEGLYYKIDVPGADLKPNLGSTVTVNYKGTLTDGSEFDSSFKRGVPLEIGLTSVIVGWQIGIPLFGKGGKGTLIIPPKLGYGSAGQNSIPGNSVLIFEIELINFK